MNEMNKIDKNVYSDFAPWGKDIQGWYSNSPLFFMLIEKIKPKIIIEVGTWKGASAFTMCTAIKELKIETIIYCVDTWLGSLEHLKLNETGFNLYKKNGYPQLYYQFLSNVIHTNNTDIITPVPLPSNIAYKFFKLNNIKPDLIYIDASHDYEDVYRDIRDYFSLLETGGIIFGDDFDQYWPDVKLAVTTFCNENNLKYTIFENKWIIQK